MSQSIAPFHAGDIVTYKYNGMRGEVTNVIDGGGLVIAFPSQNRRGDTITVTLSSTQVELVAGSSKLVSA